MYKVGLTGGIGSGKTTVAKIFQLLGVPVFDADREAKILMNTNPLIKSAIVDVFGKDAYTAEGLNRSFISNIVFNDQDKLSALNNIVHPYTIHASNEWAQQQNCKYVIKEAALLFESGSNKELDCIIVVVAPKEVRIRRVILRDKTSAQEIELRMAKQQDEELTKQLSNYIIINDDEHLVIPQVLELHQILLNKAKL